MAQRFGLYGDLTVDENMFFYADLFGLSKTEREPLIQRLLRMTRMEPFRTRRAANLSGGMKQKLALMCTLLHHPQVLFLDEPTNGVDPVSRRDFWAILYQLVRDGLTVFRHHRLSRRSRALQSRGPDEPGPHDPLRFSARALKHTLKEDVLRNRNLRSARRQGLAGLTTRRTFRRALRRETPSVPRLRPISRGAPSSPQPTIHLPRHRALAGRRLHRLSKEIPK